MPWEFLGLAGMTCGNKVWEGTKIKEEERMSKGMNVRKGIT